MSNIKIHVKQKRVNIAVDGELEAQDSAFRAEA